MRLMVCLRKFTLKRNREKINGSLLHCRWIGETRIDQRFPSIVNVAGTIKITIRKRCPVPKIWTRNSISGVLRLGNKNSPTLCSSVWNFDTSSASVIFGFQIAILSGILGPPFLEDTARRLNGRRCPINDLHSLNAVPLIFGDFQNLLEILVLLLQVHFLTVVTTAINICSQFLGDVFETYLLPLAIHSVSPHVQVRFPVTRNPKSRATYAPISSYIDRHRLL
uniref:Uncharacterized protein n=1 Tax=Rhizophora mucronata TaxID=61149 RepID=A0A2P2J7A8_RHIMU